MQGEQSPGDVRLRVLSYNVHGQRDDRAALTALVRAAAPDAVILQEAPRRFGWRRSCAALADAFGLVVAAGGLPALGNLLLTDPRVRVHRTCCRRFPLKPGRHMRGVALAECSVGSARFALAGSHLPTDPDERPEKAARLRAATGWTRLPLILGVDVNEQPGGAAWRTVADGLVDVAEAVGRSDRFTFPAKDPKRRIDAVFVDPRITVLDFDVLDDARARRASDHLPLVADLRIPAG
ncbi:MAG TPA: endonuclease/exonuclease/phosphatase family protein [Micromonosporaceae bacterium]